MMFARTAVGAAALLAGCGDSSLVRGGPELDDRSTALGAGSVDVIHGQYTNSGCTPHAAGELWSSSTTGASDLTVDKHTTTCQLELTQIDLKSAGGTTTSFFPTTNVFLDPAGGYLAGGPVGFSDQTNPVQFYLNARLSPADYSADFTVELWHSDDPRSATPPSITPRVVQGQLPQQTTPVPNYAISFLAIALTANPSGELTSVAGNALAALALGEQAGDSYVVLKNQMCPADATAAALAYVGPTTISATADLNLAGDTGFGLVAKQLMPAVTGTQLPYTDCLLIEYCDSTDCSFQTFQVTFKP